MMRLLLSGDTPDGILHDRPVLLLEDTSDDVLPDPTIRRVQLLIHVQTIRAVVPNLRQKTSLTMDRNGY